MAFGTVVSRPHGASKRLVAAAGVIGLAVGSIVMGASSASERSAVSGVPAPLTASELPSSDVPPGAPRGTVVRSSSLGIRVFVDGKHGFALAHLSRFNADYPATTLDGGKTWRVEGPHFHVSAANGPAVVTQVGAGGRSTYFAYGGPGGGNSVVVSIDRGKHWWRALVPAGAVLAVVDSGSRLVAFTNLSTPGAYVSRDGGRHWRWSSSV
jgi:hypothetical protein